MKIKLKNTVLQVDPLMLLFPIIAALLGEGAMAASLLIALTAHEFSHWVAARALGIALPLIRLTPFGGMAKLGNPYAAPPLRLAAVAAAGPAAHLLLIPLGAALCHWGLLPPTLLAQWLNVNLLLMLFNLLPALPLDGGRILWALLSLRWPKERALKWCVWSGRILAAGLVLLALWGAIVQRQVNLSPLFAALFILSSGSDEREALSNSRVQSLLSGLRPLSHPTPAELIAVEASTSPDEALRAAHSDRPCIYAVYQSGHLLRLVDEQTMLDRAAQK